MKYTISTHNGSSVSRQHNLRNPKVVAKQPHIRAGGIHETWLDKKPRQAYEEIFGDALEEYNKKQIEAGRPGRVIKSYYDAVKEDLKKHDVYEMIVAVGSKKISPPVEVAKDILREFVDTWHERNSSLHMIGAYYHHDEQGVGHVHIDYVPVGHGYKNGLRIQNGLVKALGEIGFASRSARDTAQMQWEHRENEYLEKLCNQRGLEIEHPLEEGRKHKDTERYKAEEELKELRAKCDYLAERAQKMYEEGEKRFKQYQNTLNAKKAQINALEAKIEALEEEVRHQKTIYEIFGGDSSKLQVDALQENNPENETIDLDDLRNV